VGIQALNKFLFRDYNFNYGVALTAFHMFATSLGCYITLQLKIFEYKALPIAQVIPLSAAFCFSIAFNNLSLVYNTVGIALVFKIAITPCVVLCEYLIFGSRYSKEAIVSVSFITVGVALVTLRAFPEGKNLIGFAVAIVGTISTTLYQLYVGRQQKTLKADPLQLMLFQAPVAFLMLCLLVPFFESISDLIGYNFSDGIVSYLILGTGIFAFGVNLSVFFYNWKDFTSYL